MKIFNFINSANNKYKFNPDNVLYFYLKPETSLLKNKMPFFLPDFSKDIRCNLGIIIKICKLGKSIKEKFAYNYYKEIGLCINMIAYDILQELIIKGLPWDKAVSFDSSTVISDFLPYSNDFIDSKLAFELSINNITYGICDMTHTNLSFNKAIEIISKFYTLKIGDYLIIENLNCNITLQLEDLITGFISGEKRIEFKIK